MATSGCSCVTSVQTFENAFYFQVATATDVDEDTFRISPMPSKNRLVRSSDSKYLVLNAEGQFQVQNLNSDQLCHPDCKFKIHNYEDKCEGKPAVMLYLEINNKNMVVCCGDQHDIYPEEMDHLPSQIEAPKHKALFYMTKCTASNTFMFESSKHSSEFLGFEPADDPSLDKLVLHRKVDEVDDSCRICLLMS